MTVRILLARHGNTFEAGEKAVFAGARNDLPLTAAGRLQAKEVGLLLARSGALPSRIITGPLLRTTEFGEIVARELSNPPAVSIDHRLNELDYGRWAGLTSAEIEASFGARELEDWNERAVWPKNADWPETESEFVAATLSLLAEVRASGDSLLLLVTSNGRLRYVPKAIPGAFESLQGTKQLKVGTGNLCLLSFEDGAGKLEFWNCAPASLRSI